MERIEHGAFGIRGLNICRVPGPVHQCPPRIEEDDLGPYFIPNTELGLSGDIAPSDEVNLRVEGVVYDSACRPVAGAKVEVWHASPHNGRRTNFSKFLYSSKD